MSLITVEDQWKQFGLIEKRVHQYGDSSSIVHLEFQKKVFLSVYFGTLDAKLSLRFLSPCCRAGVISGHKVVEGRETTTIYCMKCRSASSFTGSPPEQVFGTRESILQDSSIREFLQLTYDPLETVIVITKLEDKLNTILPNELV